MDLREVEKPAAEPAVEQPAEPYVEVPDPEPQEIEYSGGYNQPGFTWDDED